MKDKTKKIIWIIIIIGIIIRLIYIIKTPIDQRQHDVYSIGEQGHLEYIYTIYETGKLPITNSKQFYHPPLYHFVAAKWLKLETFIGIPFETALEGIQVLTLIFSSTIMIVVYHILNKINIKDRYKIFIILMMAVHPTFIILSGSINNDILMILFVFIIILYLLKWDEKSDYKNMSFLALATGLCVMSKISGGIMAVPIMVVFIKKIIETKKKNKKELIRLFGLFTLFGIISLPLGLWHPIRNKILFNQPIGGVLIPGDFLYVGNYSFIQRFLKISFKELTTTFCVIPGDYNVPAYIIKTSVLGEFNYDRLFLIANVIKWINVIIVLFSIIALIWQFIFNKNKDNFTFNLILETTYIIYIVSYVLFNIKYPYVCTMDFRYIVPTIFVGTYYSCKFFEYFSNKQKFRIFTECSEYLFVVFCCISAGMMIVL